MNVSVVKATIKNVFYFVKKIKNVKLDRSSSDI